MFSFQIVAFVIEFNFFLDIYGMVTVNDLSAHGDIKFVNNVATSTGAASGLLIGDESKSNIGCDLACSAMVVGAHFGIVLIVVYLHIILHLMVIHMIVYLIIKKFMRNRSVVFKIHVKKRLFFKYQMKLTLHWLMVVHKQLMRVSIVYVSNVSLTRQNMVKIQTIEPLQCKENKC